MDSSDLLQMIALRQMLSSMNDREDGPAPRMPERPTRASANEAPSHEDVKKKLTESGPNSFTIEEFETLLHAKRARSVKLLLEGGFRVTGKVLKAIIKAPMTELMMPIALKQESATLNEISPSMVKYAAQTTILQMIETGLIVTPASLHTMAKCMFWEAVGRVLAKTPGLGLVRHKGDPVWFAVGYELASGFIPKVDLHQSTCSTGMTYLMERLNTRGADISDLPLSADPAEGFDPNHLSEGGKFSLTPLTIAMATTDVLAQAKQVQLLLDAGADPDPALKTGTLLSFMGSGNVAVLEALLDAGASLNKRGKKGDLPLVELITYKREPKYNRRTEIADTMVEFMDPAEFTKNDLKKLVEAGHCEVITIVLRWLLKAGRRDLIHDTRFDSGQDWVDEYLAILE